MSRYIDADEFEDELYEHEFSNWCDKDEVSELIDNMPSADVEPVKHGRWIKSKAGGVLCSECCSYALYVEKGSFTTKRIEQEKSAYCPNCGAKMDGGVDE